MTYTRELTIYMRELTIYMRELTIYMRELTIYMRELTIYMRELTIYMRELTIYMRELLARVCDALPTGFEPVARVVVTCGCVWQHLQCPSLRLEPSRQRVANARQPGNVCNARA